MLKNSKFVLNTLVSAALLLNLSATTVMAQAPLTSPITSPIITTPTPTPAPSQGSNSNSSVLAPIDPGYNTQAPVCGDTKPMSAPVIISALSNEANTVTIYWSKAQDPVTYYLISYGTKPGVAEFGNPNVGNKNTTSYVVKGLSAGTYYFRVRAGNGCMPGAFSNEVAVKVSGRTIDAPAVEFNGHVLSATQSAEVTFKPITAYQPTRITNTATGIMALIQKIWSIFHKS